MAIYSITSSARRATRAPWSSRTSQTVLCFLGDSEKSSVCLMSQQPRRLGMRDLILRGAALIAFGVSVSANAADMPVKAPILPEPPYNWSGGYVGANFGAAWTNGNLNIPNNNFYGGLTEFIAGVEAGYNVQFGHLLFGVEGDFDG